MTKVVSDIQEAIWRGRSTSRLTKYLTDAHSIEVQALTQLRTAPEIAAAPELAEAFRLHLTETEGQERLTRELLERRGADTSKLKDVAAMRLGALNWGAFFQGHPDSPGKLTAFAYAFEHLEIGGYEQLRRVATTAGDAETERIAETILGEERGAARSLRLAFDTAAAEALRAVGVPG